MEFVNVFGCVLLWVCAFSCADATDKAGSGSRGGDYDPSARQPDSSAELSRHKRTLVYPKPSTLLLIFGLGTPLQLDRESVIVGAFTKMIYTLPTNSSSYTEPGILYERRSRWNIYKTLARLSELYGFGEGRACVLRAICEAASAPFEPRSGLLQRLLQTFLKPSSTKEHYEEYGDREYLAAERLGEHVGENCHALYPECRASFLDVFSSLRTSLLA